MGRSEAQRSRRITPSWAVVAIVVFVVVDAALVWWALSSVRADTDAPQGEVLPTIPPPRTSTPTPGAAAPTPKPARVIRSTVVLAAFDASTAYRGTTGTCEGDAATIEVTVDGGATWNAGVTEGLTDLQSVEPSVGDIVSVVARDAACTLGRYRSYVQGDDWEATGELEPTWYVDGDTAVAPGGESTPCDGAIGQLAAATAESAVVLCDTSDVLVTSDSGATWTTTASAGRTVAIGAGPAGYIVAVTGDGCRGIRIAAIGAGLDVDAPEPGACLEAKLTPGTTAVDVAPDGTVWAWAGGVLARSADGGGSW